MAKKNKETLWGREWQIVKHGLDKQPVIEFVDELMAKLKEAQEKAETPAYPSSLDRLAEQTVVEAEKLAEKLKGEAQQIRTQAQAEAARTIAEAQTTAQEQAGAIGRVAKTAAEEAQRVVQAAREKGALIEAEGRQRAEQLLDFTKRRIESQVRRDVKGASEKLLQYMDDIKKGVQALDVDLENWEATAPGVSLPLPEPVEAQQASGPAERKAADTVLHEGTLQVIIQAPVYPAGLGEVYQRLEQLQDITLRDTSRAGDGSYVIKLSLGCPTPLLNVLRHLENVADVSVGPPAMSSAVGDGSGEAQSIEEQSAAPKTRILVKLKE